MSTARIHRTGWMAAGVAVAMVGAAYAAVPLYKLFCQVTGYGGTTQRAEAAALPRADEVAKLGGKMVNVRFDANVAPGLSWSFKPVDTLDPVRIGERRIAFFRAQNTGKEPITGTASFNVSPETAGPYFVKIECFCFTEQTLQPGESIDMPVTYFIDPAILKDPDAQKIEEITLSYTFFPSQPKAGR